NGLLERRHRRLELVFIHHGLIAFSADHVVVPLITLGTGSAAFLAPGACPVRGIGQIAAFRFTATLEKRRSNSRATLPWPHAARPWGTLSWGTLAASSGAEDAASVPHGGLRCGRAAWAVHSSKTR